MFGISEEHVVERDPHGDHVIRRSDGGVWLSANRTIPGMIVDGVDSISVVEESTDRYRVEYTGYCHGYLSTTRAGVEELGANLLRSDREIPGWVVSSNVEELPDWIPSSYRPPDPVTCEVCGDEVAVTAVLTPLEDDLPDRCCPDCWDEY